MSLLYRLKFTFYAFVKHSKWFAVVALGEEPRGHLFWVKREEMTEGRKAGWASKIEPGPLLSSKSGSATTCSKWFDLYTWNKRLKRLKQLPCIAFQSE